MSTAAKKKRLSFQAGTIVTVHISTRGILARIVEDRGRIGVGGRRLLRVQPLNADLGDLRAFEIPADGVSPAPAMSLEQARDLVAHYIVPEPFAETDAKGRCWVGTRGAPGRASEVREWGNTFEQAVTRFKQRYPQYIVEDATRRMTDDV